MPKTISRIWFVLSYFAGKVLRLPKWNIANVIQLLILAFTFCEFCTFYKREREKKKGAEKYEKYVFLCFDYLGLARLKSVFGSV